MVLFHYYEPWNIVQFSICFNLFFLLFPLSCCSNSYKLFSCCLLFWFVAWFKLFNSIISSPNVHWNDLVPAENKRIEKSVKLTEERRNKERWMLTVIGRNDLLCTGVHSVGIFVLFVCLKTLKRHCGSYYEKWEAKSPQTEKISEMNLLKESNKSRIKEDTERER